ncbi:hypothetical protein PSKAS_30000 [Peribacillus sp. N1]
MQLASNDLPAKMAMTLMSAILSQIVGSVLFGIFIYLSEPKIRTAAISNWPSLWTCYVYKQCFIQYENISQEIK